MTKGIVRLLKIVSKNVNREIADLSQGFYGGGLGSEGYAGGYRDAIQDVMLALNGVPPNRRDYWPARTTRDDDA